MLAIQVNMNILLLAALVIAAAGLGYLIRSSQIRSLNKKLGDLEKEMLASHAEILQLHRDKIDLMKSIAEPVIPVIPITNGIEDKNIEKLPDGTTRKKLLSTTPVIKQQSGS